MLRCVCWAYPRHLTPYPPPPRPQRFLIYSSMAPVVHLANVQGDYELHEALTRDDDEGGGVMCAKFSAGEQSRLALLQYSAATVG
jgi:hypothetical protein